MIREIYTVWFIFSFLEKVWLDNNLKMWHQDNQDKLKSLERGHEYDIFERMFHLGINFDHLGMRAHKCGTGEKSLKHPFDFLIPKSNCERKKLDELNRKLLFCIKPARTYGGIKYSDGNTCRKVSSKEPGLIMSHIPHTGVCLCMECEVKWALESITMNQANGGDGIPVELFQILKDDAVKALHSICQQIWKTQQWPQDWTRSVFIPIPKAMPKNAQTTTQLHSSHTLVK